MYVQRTDTIILKGLKTVLTNFMNNRYTAQPIGKQQGWQIYAGNWTLEWSYAPNQMFWHLIYKRKNYRPVEMVEGQISVLGKTITKQYRIIGEANTEYTNLLDVMGLIMGNTDLI